MAQNGQPTGTYPPVAGGAGGNPITNPGYYGGYYATGAFRYAVPRRMYMYAPPHRSSSHRTQKWFQDRAQTYIRSQTRSLPGEIHRHIAVE